jgi:hypothetical protein
MDMAIIPRKALPAPAKTTQSAISRNRQGRYLSQAAQDKAVLVDLGLECLSRGEWSMAWTISCLIRERGLSHE